MNKPLEHEYASHVAYTRALEEYVATQAAVIEKLKRTVRDLIEFEMQETGARHSFDLCCEYQIAVDAISIPTDSKEVLKEWLDEVLGEPVGYMSNESAYRLKHGGNSKGAVPVHLTPSSVSKIPLFRKPEVK